MTINTIGKSAKPRVIVCQHGARHRYAVARLLEDAGMLSALYTDSSAYSVTGRFATALNKFGLRHPSLKAFVARIPKGIPRKKIFSTDHALHLMLNGAPWFDLSPAFKRWGLRDANVVYSMCGEDYDFLCWAKEQGAKIVIDVFVHPSTTRLVAEENERIKGVAPDMEMVDAIEGHFMQTFELADVLVCPSEWVADGVRSFAGNHEQKIRIVPYGSSLKPSPSINESPVGGRILFAGRDPLRKGLHYLAAAAKEVRDAGVNVDVHVAGLTSGDVQWIEHKNELNCLGTVPMGKMHEEFRQADVFVLPSLSEGQAGVLLEAMSCGCPVIATKESGVDFDVGCGVTVPARDCSALAAAIMDVLSSRERRNQFANNALKQSEMFSTDAWRQRLLGAVNEAVSIGEEVA
jgi:glycosyltransferase involved in cell wall biosynthesis